MLIGVQDFGRGWYDGMTGLVRDPYRGFKSNGVKGLGIGVLKGLAGCIVKPTTGILDGVTHTFQGIRSTAVGLDGHAVVCRVRTPRFFATDGQLTLYSERESEGYLYVVLLNVHQEETYIYHIDIQDPTLQLNTAKGSSSNLTTATSSTSSTSMNNMNNMNNMNMNADTNRANREKRANTTNATVPLSKRSLVITDRFIRIITIKTKNVSNNGVIDISNLKVSRKESTMSMTSLSNNGVKGGELLTFQSNAVGHTISVLANTASDAKRLLYMLKEGVINGDHRDARRQAILWDLEDIIGKNNNNNNNNNAATINTGETKANSGNSNDTHNSNDSNQQVSLRHRRKRSQTAPTSKVPQLFSSSSIVSTVRKSIVLRAKEKIRRRKCTPTSAAVVDSRTCTVRVQMNRRKSKHTLYTITVRSTMTKSQRNNQFSNDSDVSASIYNVIWDVERRYSDFVRLRGILNTALSHSDQLIALPSKRVRNMLTSVIQERIQGLEMFLKNCFENEKVVHNTMFVAFLSTDSVQVRVTQNVEK